jgi:purine-binding chemotaxis protein CheW
MKRDETAARAAQYLTFFVDGDEYAVDIMRIREVIEAIPVTHVPATPPAIRGVVNLRGAVVPVIDLAIRFGLPERTITSKTCIVLIEVVVEGEPTVMGILVDAVNQVIDLDASQIEPVPPFGAHVRLDFLTGMGVAGEKFVMLLDADLVLSPTDLLAAAALPDSMAPPSGDGPQALEPAESGAA